MCIRDSHYDGVQPDADDAAAEPGHELAGQVAADAEEAVDEHDEDQRTEGVEQRHEGRVGFALLVGEEVEAVDGDRIADVIQEEERQIYQDDGQLLRAEGLQRQHPQAVVRFEQPVGEEHLSLIHIYRAYSGPDPHRRRARGSQKARHRVRLSRTVVLSLAHR